MNKGINWVSEFCVWFVGVWARHRTCLLKMIAPRYLNEAEWNGSRRRIRGKLRCVSLKQEATNIHINCILRHFTCVWDAVVSAPHKMSSAQRGSWMYPIIRGFINFPAYPLYEFRAFGSNCDEIGQELETGSDWHHYNFIHLLSVHLQVVVSVSPWLQKSLCKCVLQWHIPRLPPPRFFCNITRNWILKLHFPILLHFSLLSQLAFAPSIMSSGQGRLCI